MRIRLLIVAFALAFACALPAQALGDHASLSVHQRAVLHGIAADTWKFYAADVDPTTHLPLDNLGPGDVARHVHVGGEHRRLPVGGGRGARPGPDHHQRADSLVTATLDEVSTLKRFDGMLYQWYDTNNGNVLSNPGQGDCTGTTPEETDTCWFVSAVDNGWYATGLIEVRQALPELAALADRLLAPMDFSIFYDNRAQTTATPTPSLPGNQPTGQQYGGYYVDQGPAGYHNGALYSDPRISMYIGMGMHQMPGDVWWRTWRTLPPQQCTTDPDFSCQGQWPTPGYWHTYTDPQSGKKFPVWEGHYVYPGTSLRFVPTFAGGMFEGLMANLVVPETTWGTHSFGLADLRWAQVQVKYATARAALSGLGHFAFEHCRRHRRLRRLRRRGLAFAPSNDGLAQCTTCATETTVSPHASAIALPILPQQAYANLQALRTLYPGIYTADGGFYDAVNPETGSIGHRRLVLDQSMIMAGLDDALNHDALQRRFASDPLSWAAHLYLSIERMSIG